MPRSAIRQITYHACCTPSRLVDTLAGFVRQGLEEQTAAMDLYKTAISRAVIREVSRQVGAKILTNLQL